MTATRQDAGGSDFAVARGEAARLRADELRQRRGELAEGLAADAHTAEIARLHAEQSLERAKRAHRVAAARHIEASAAHRRAAATHEQAALLAGDGTGDAHQDAAELHRTAAAKHDVAAVHQVHASD